MKKQTEIWHLNMPSSEEDSVETFLFSLTSLQQQPDITVYIENIPFPFIIDSGSSVNLINTKLFWQTH